MISETEVLKKLCNMLRADNLRSLSGIAEVEVNEDMTMSVKKQLTINYDDRISENNQWLSDCNTKLRHFAAIAGK